MTRLSDPVECSLHFPMEPRAGHHQLINQCIDSEDAWVAASVSHVGEYGVSLELAAASVRAIRDCCLDWM